MGRRHMKKVPQNGTVASHERYLYRGYLQIAAQDMLDNRNVLRTLLWDPLEPVATRPLALAQGASLYCYGMDFNKNVSEVFDAQGTIAAAYDYSPYGTATRTGRLVQPVQWSGEMHDEEPALAYYNYRFYNPKDGRWINRDPIAEEGGWNLYAFLGNRIYLYDTLGKFINFLISGVVSAVTEVAVQVVTNYVEEKPLFDIDYTEVVSAGVIGIIPGPSIVQKVKQISKICSKNKRVVDSVVRLTNEIEKLKSSKKVKAKLIASLEKERTSIITYNNQMWISYFHQKMYVYVVEGVRDGAIKSAITNIMKAFGLAPKEEKIEKCSAEISLKIETESFGIFMSVPPSEKENSWPPKLR